MAYLLGLFTVSTVGFFADFPAVALPFVALFLAVALAEPLVAGVDITSPDVVMTTTCTSPGTAPLEGIE